MKSRASREIAEGAQDGGREILFVYRQENRAQAEVTASEEAEETLCLLTVRGSPGSEKEVPGREEGVGGVRCRGGFTLAEVLQEAGLHAPSPVGPGLRQPALLSQLPSVDESSCVPCLRVAEPRVF